MGAPHDVPGSGRRLLLAAFLTAWAALQALTMVLAVVRGGSPDDAMRWWVTGLWTALLAAAAVWAWRRVASVREEAEARTRLAGALHDRSAPSRTPGLGEPDEASGPGRPSHRGLSGELEPPRRW